MKFGHFFVDRPIFAAVVSIVTVVVGLVAYFNLPISQYPQIAPPTITVNATYPGANAQTIAETVATPLEQAINGVEGMIYQTSQSTNDGSLQITVTFATGTNLDIAQVQVQNRISTAEPRLPAEVRTLGVTVNKASADFLLIITMYSPDHSMNEYAISNYSIVNINEDVYRQRFSAAHEVAHAIFDSDQSASVSFSSAGKDDLLERRANRFASCYLMPPAFFAKQPVPWAP